MKTPYHEYSQEFVRMCVNLFRRNFNTMQISRELGMRGIHVPESVVYNALAQRNRHVS